MSITTYEIRPGAYYDSVVLMQLQKGLTGLPGVEDAGVVMATPANREVLASTGFDLSDVSAAADDLLIVVRAEEEDAAAAALAQVDELLRARRGEGGTAAYRPRSLDTALKMLPSAEWVLISVPGRYAAGVAHEALDHGRHVFLYSDNVSIEDELALKMKASERGLLLMGPDCGTAIVNGAGLGFANRVRRGFIGLVAASGTGLQAVAAGIHNRGGGLSQALGTGGRDLKEAIGGLTALRALAYLRDDPQTAVICLVSKPPAPAIAARLLRAARRCGKPVVVCLIGYPSPAKRLGNLHFAASLDDAAAQAVALTDGPPGVPEGDADPLGGAVRGLFAGGTLATATLLALQTTLAPLTSNVPLRPDQAMDDVWRAEGHAILDLGEDDFTQGRLHPMLDQDLRLRRFEQEAANPAVGLILLDFVLGEGAHNDPAAEWAEAISAALARRPALHVVAVVVGSEDDPQDAAGQAERLAAAGATVFRTVEAAATYITALPQAVEVEAVPPRPFTDPLVAINVGLESFAGSLHDQGVEALHVDWRPPAGGDEKMMALLARLKGG